RLLGLPDRPCWLKSSTGSTRVRLRRPNRLRSRRNRLLALLVLASIAALSVWIASNLLETRVRVVEPGRLVRGAWQEPYPLKRLIEREQIRTIVTLTAINKTDPKYVKQKNVVESTGVGWVLIPMRGSTASLDQMAEAADLLADPARQPVFFHCVGGHHRTGLVHAAYRIRHQGWTAEQAWNELRALPWTRPDADRDRQDHRLIEAFAAREQTHPRRPLEPEREDLIELAPSPPRLDRPDSADRDPDRNRRLLASKRG
ncbi:MAG TPA: hypothetical protein VFT74_19485, partial [Isosphaeraceae bacterium]|nr:hypothetical protein [Isosphaeraceae bacterium]